jgi:hypothetical protein
MCAAHYAELAALLHFPGDTADELSSDCFARPYDKWPCDTADELVQKDPWPLLNCPVGSSEVRSTACMLPLLHPGSNAACASARDTHGIVSLEQPNARRAEQGLVISHHWATEIIAVLQEMKRRLTCAIAIKRTQNALKEAGGAAGSQQLAFPSDVEKVRSELTRASRA